MGSIVCTMFGSPMIKENDNLVYLPAGKISGLFFYILMKKSVSRDEVAGIFWPNSNEERAKISLRNALHKLRKYFSEDIIMTPNKSVLKLNENINFIIDAEDFENNPLKNLYLYKGDFLKGFFIKDTADFDNWLTEQRSYYEEIYLNNVEKKVIEDIDNDSFDNVEINIRNMLSIDAFNEDAYLLLMNFYMKNGRYDKVINEYYNVSEILSEELGIAPSGKIEKVYKEALEKVEEKQGNKGKKENFILYDRNFELNQIRHTIDNFYNEEDLKSIILRGEIGVGKSIIIKQILEENKDKFNIFQTNCYRIEQEFSFSPWHKIIYNLNKEIRKRNEEPPIMWNDVLYKLFPDAADTNIVTKGILENRENFNLDIIYNVVFSAIEQISVDKKTIIVMEDIQWADTLSIKLLINLALHLNRDVMFIITTNEENNQKIDNLILSLKSVNKMLVLDIERFDKATVKKIILESFKNKNVNEKIIDEIYVKSKGNALFLSEYIELYKNGQRDLLNSDTINELLKTKFTSINVHERHILEKISLFYKEIPLEMLLKFGNTNAFDVVTAISSLEQKSIIEVYDSGNQTYIKFVHKAYRDYIYQNLNRISKKIMHLEVAKVMESELKKNKSDITQLVKIKNHYELANEKVKVIKYEVNILNYYLNFNHELFPNLDDFDLNNQIKIYIKNSKVLEKLENIENEILQIKNYLRTNENTKEIDNIELMFLYCKGRYCIREGNYSEGTKVMNRVIKLAEEVNNNEILLLGYKQMVIYGIQINEPEIMISYIIPAIKVAKKLNDISGQGVLLRLYGLYHLMKKDPKQAENLFINSIKLFESSGRITNGNSVSIAADYNYIGEIRKAEGDFEKAIELFEKSISLSEDVEVSCLSIFYVNLGKTYFLIEDYKKMRECFVKSKEIINKFDSYWENTIIDSYLALSSFICKDYLKTIEYLKNASLEIRTINNPRDLGAIYFIKALISIRVKNTLSDNIDILKEYLKEPTEYYFYQAMRYLDSFRDKFEIDYLKKIADEKF